MKQYVQKLDTSKESRKAQNLTITKVFFILCLCNLFSACLIKDSERVAKIPKDLKIESVTFGSISKEKVSRSYVKVNYPCQIELCFNKMDSVAPLFQYEAAPMYISQKIITKDSVTWNYEALTNFLPGRNGSVNEGSG